MRPNWYSRENEKFDLEKPGIYEWRIEGVGVYVGKAAKLRSRISDYPNNVRRMLQGLDWHGDPSKDYRPIHHALRHAHDEGITVTVVVLANCELGERQELERQWIAVRREEHFSGGPEVLNGRKVLNG